MPSSVPAVSALARLFGKQKPKDDLILGAILENLPESIIIADQNGKIIKTNTRAQNLLLPKAEKLISRPLTEIVAILDQAKKDKNFPQTRITITQIKNNSEIIATVAIILDSNREKEVEKMETEFLSLAAHQLRSPLGSVRWALEMLLNGDVAAIPNVVKETLERIYSSNQWMITLVNDLLSVSRIEQGRVQDEPILVNFLDIIKTVIDELEFDATKKSEKIRLITENIESAEIMIDPKRFREVIQNLLSNAVKYNSQGKSVDVYVALSGDILKINITDYGIGIPKGEESKIFTRFYRTKNALKTRVEGTGLGLFVVKSYVEKWGGKINFKSSQDKGSTFYLELPVRFTS